ncbi:hypothetical protein BFG57_03985 [Bacillus solimangrovi]|uniref:Glycosyltransferase RgtA/B/C/D-like domain-containing protein n=1 Tax=Bacillus solimangrovi TaxID=1305675 RepID=A0A1E5LCW9_9BACI|nr:hypothetical protein BFG57_03985 [Bacillus solimangrovi]
MNGLIIILILLISLTRLFFISNYARSWDAVDFALGVLQFDLLQMQPHFPGYPYFIVGGMFFNQFMHDPIESLIMLNIVLITTTILPLYWISKRFVTERNALLITALIQTMPYLNILTIQPMSEAAGVSILIWYIWSLFVSIEKKEWKYLWITPFLFGLLMGIRVSYLVFGVGLLWCVIVDLRDHKGNKLIRFFSHFMLNCIFQLIWVWGLVSSLGGINSFMKIGWAFVEGHFQEWGGTAITEQVSLLERFIRLTFEQWIWSSWFAQSIGIVFITVITIIIGLVMKKNKSVAYSGYYLIVTMSSSYFIWVLFAQNIDKPRHIMPFTIFVFILILIKLFTYNKSTLFYSCVTVLLFSQFYFSIGLMNDYNRQVPATYQLAYYLDDIEEPFTVYTWEETRVLEYLNMPYEHKRLLTYEYFLEDIVQMNHTIFVTERLLQGFRSQGINVDDKIKEIEEFHSNPLFDPVYHDIKLYKWKNDN